jgi:hypothetical protein
LGFFTLLDLEPRGLIEMRSLLAFVLLAGAASAVATSASSRPTISLDLGSLAGLHKSPYEQHAGIACKISTTHKLCRKRTSSGPHNPHSESKYSKTCIAKAANAKNCALPKAVAWDHHDGKLDVSKEIFLVNDDGRPGRGKVPKINWKLRAEYVVKYDAKDTSENHAEQVSKACKAWVTATVITVCLLLYEGLVRADPE